MKKKLLFICIFTTFLAHSQKKIQNTTAKKVASSKTEKSSGISPLFVNYESNCVEISQKLKEEIVAKGFERTIYKICDNINHNNYYSTYEYVNLEKDKNQFFIKENGEFINAGKKENFLTITKNGNLVTHDKCNPKGQGNEFVECGVIKFSDKNGSPLKNTANLSNYTVIKGLVYGDTSMIYTENGVFVALKNNTSSNYNILNQNGQLLNKNNYYNVEQLYNNFVAVKSNENSHFEILDLYTLKQQSTDFDNFEKDAKFVTTGLLFAKKGEKRGVYDLEKNNWLFLDDYSKISPYFFKSKISKNIFVVNKNEQKALVDSSNNILIPFGDYNISEAYQLYSNPNENPLIVLITQKDGSFNPYDVVQKKYLWNKFYKSYERLSDSIYLVKENDYYEVINMENSSIIISTDKKIVKIDKDLFPFLILKNNSGETSLINIETQNVIISDVKDIYPVRNTMDYYVKNYFKIKLQNGKESVIDKTGKIVLPENYYNGVIKFDQNKNIFLNIRHSNNKILNCYDMSGKEIEIKSCK